MRRAALVVLVFAAIAGCGSTVLLGTLPTDDGGGGGADLSGPRFDGFDGGDFGGTGDGFDAGPIFDFGADLGSDAGALVDLAQ